MTPAWAQRQEELLSDCIVSPDVFNHMVDRLRDCVVPSQTVWRPRRATGMSTSTSRACCPTWTGRRPEGVSELLISSQMHRPDS